jgi:hypothetical protein
MALYSVTGQKILEVTNTDKANISSLHNGVYILKIQTNSDSELGNEKTHKVIITN